MASIVSVHAIVGELDALASGRSEDLRRTAHTLTDSSACLGAARLAESSREVEATARDARLEGLGARIDGTGAAFDDVVAALEARAGGGG